MYLQLYRFFSRVCLRAHGCTFSYTKFSHGCALHSCVEILRYEMTDADQFTKWREEIREFMEPLATNAGRADFIEGLDGVVYEFPLQLYTHVAMAGKSKKTNYRFQF